MEDRKNLELIIEETKIYDKHLESKANVENLLKTSRQKKSASSSWEEQDVEKESEVEIKEEKNSDEESDEESGEEFQNMESDEEEDDEEYELEDEEFEDEDSITSSQAKRKKLSPSDRPSTSTAHSNYTRQKEKKKDENFLNIKKTMSPTNASIINVSSTDASTLLPNSAIKSKISSGELKISKKRGGKSKVWNVFGKVDYLSGEEIPNVVACRICKNVYKYTGVSTSNLVKHKCYIEGNSEVKDHSKIDVDVETKKNMTRILTEWTIANCRPFKIVEDSGFNKVAEHLIKVGSKFGANVNVKSLLPHPTTTSRNIKNLYKVYFEKIKTEINQIKDIGFGLTSDLWTDNYLRKTYISLTIHYIKDLNIVCRVLGMKSMKGERITDENIKQKIIKLLYEFNLDLNENDIIVTDRGSNMAAAFSNHIYCINHLLHNTVQKSIQEVSEVAELSSLCAKLVKYFKMSGLNSKLATTLKSFSPTRWNSIYNLFVTIKENWSDIIQCLQQKDELNRISNINIKHVSELITLLEPFENTFKKLEGENYPTIHLVYLHIHLLKRKCSADVADEEITKQFKEKLLGYLDTIVLQNLTIYHKIALFLFPPLNKLVHFNGDEKIQIKNKCKSLISNCLEDDGEIETQSRDVSGISNENIELISYFLPQAQNPSSMNKVDSEILKYESLDVTFYNEFNILQWWEVNKKEFPLLFKLSCKILATPASSASSQRVFSAARNLITEERCKIASNDDDTINETMFLHSNIPKSDLQNGLSRTDILNNDIV